MPLERVVIPMGEQVTLYAKRICTVNPERVNDYEPFTMLPGDSLVMKSRGPEPCFVDYDSDDVQLMTPEVPR